jgi:hypothetical protein
MVHRDHRSRAWHILNDEAGIARNVERHEAGEEPRPAIVEAARSQPHDDADGLSFVEGFALRIEVAGAMESPGQSAEKKNRFGVFSRWH